MRLKSARPNCADSKRHANCEGKFWVWNFRVGVPPGYHHYDITTISRYFINKSAGRFAYMNTKANAEVKFACLFFQVCVTQGVAGNVQQLPPFTATARPNLTNKRAFTVLVLCEVLDCQSIASTVVQIKTQGRIVLAIFNDCQVINYSLASITTSHLHCWPYTKTNYVR